MDEPDPLVACCTEVGGLKHLEVSKLALQLDQIHHLMCGHHAQSLILDYSQEMIASLPSNRLKHAMQKENHGLGDYTSEHQHGIDLRACREHSDAGIEHFVQPLMS
jgi:hypothetical protein